MNEAIKKGHHPLPKDERARHDLLPENIEDVRELGDDDPLAPRPSKTEAPREHYVNPDGSAYQS
jgi:hypothetical protein